ncbi:MAG: dTDP-4-dehydrorhamnose 3,5-epimerase family protein [Victivallaceae bacterium]|nr:dTDP-4-dehydrorhamnose 3,5-epimerase family protein [Victivallaceae bacterium]
MIQGVAVKELITFDDERGFFREIIQHTDDFFSAGFGQLSHSLVNAGVVKAWHGHNYQTQWNYVATGLIKVALYDNRETSETYEELMEFFCGDSHPAQVYMFPPGVLHGYKCLTAPMNIIYVTSGTYDLDDEVRIKHSEVNYDWNK